MTMATTSRTSSTLEGDNLKGMDMGLADDAVDDTGVLGISFSQEETICYEEDQCDRIKPTLIEQLKLQGYTQRNAYSMWLNDLDSDAGSILFGAIDEAKYHGDLISLPMQPDDDSGNVTDFSVTLSSVSITTLGGTEQLSLSNLSVPAVLDSGTFDTELPSDIANKIMTGMGSVMVDGVNAVPCRYRDANATIIYGFGGPGGPKISIPISEMIIDAEFQFQDGSEGCYLGIDSVDVDLGGIVLFGDTFLRSAYVVYDLENKQIALAQTNFNATSSNIKLIPTGTGLPGVSHTATESVVIVTAVETELPGGYPSTASGIGTVLETGTPTFNLGPAISKTGSTPSASKTSGHSGAGMTRPAITGCILESILVLAVFL